MKSIKYLIIFFIIFSFVSCTKKEIVPPTLVLSSSTIDLGSITSNSTANLTLTQNGEGSISYTISSNKSWLKLAKTSGTLSTTDAIALSTVVPSTDLTDGENTATLTITPTINGVVSPAMNVTVKGIYKITMLNLPTNSVDFGTITTTKSMYLKLSKVGTENLTFDAVADKSWLLIDRASGTATEKDSLKLTVDTKQLSGGNQTATITLTPKVNGSVGTPITVSVKVNYDDAITGTIQGHTLTKNETWKGEINLTGTIKVPVGYTLTIKPGTKVNVKYIDAGIDIVIDGKLIMNGDASNIIVMKSANANPNIDDWNGIQANGDIEVSYAYLRDCYYGLNFLVSGIRNAPTKAPSIHHVLFENSFSGIGFLTTAFETKLSNLTFRNLKFNAIYISEAKKLTMSEMEFLSSLGDVSIFDDNMNLTIENSNFVQKKYDFYNNVYVYDDAKYKNNNVELKNCYNAISFAGFNKYGNVLKNTSPATAPNQNIGCGFTNKFSNARISQAMPTITTLSEMEKIRNDIERTLQKRAN